MRMHIKNRNCTSPIVMVSSATVFDLHEQKIVQLLSEGRTYEEIKAPISLSKLDVVMVSPHVAVVVTVL